MLIMRMGTILNNGLEQTLLFQNSMNIDVSEVLETYSYSVGLKQGRFAFGTAIGLFQSVVGCIMVFVSNFISKKQEGADCGEPRHSKKISKDTGNYWR